MVQHDPPHRLGEWLLDQRCGAGAFGSVWLAHDGRGHTAVVKVLAGPPGEEIRALSRVYHPSVVRPLGAGGHPVPYVALELANGTALTDSPMEESDAVRIVACLADALAACHQAGVAHGDVKPANVVHDLATGQVTLVDFGLAGSAGGTVRYAAPERMRGGRATPAADVWALGTLADVLLGDQGPPWLSEVVRHMRADEANRRPSARAVADVFEANGVELPAPTAEVVRRRAASAHVARPSVDRAVEDWVEQGGIVSIVGPSDSGRSHALRQAAVELQARGRPFTMLRPAATPWASVAAALVDPGLPGLPTELPAAADPLVRAEAAADALLTRAESTGDEAKISAPPTFLVDDWEGLDDGTRATVEALMRTDARVLVASFGPVPHTSSTVQLAPLRPDEAEALVRAVLGPADAALVASSGGNLPGRLLRVMDAGVRTGAISWRSGAWVTDPELLRRVADSVGDTFEVSFLTEAELRLGGVVALIEPVSPDLAARWSDTDDTVRRSLVAKGWVRADPALTCQSPAAARVLRRHVAPELHRRLLDDWLRQPTVPWDRVGPALVGARDLVAAQELGARCVLALLDLDPAKAAELGESLSLLLGSCPSGLVAARMKALVRSGRMEEARRVGEQHVAGRALDREDAEVLLQLVSVEEHVSEDPASMLARVEAAAALYAPDPVPHPIAFARARALWRAGRLEEAEEACSVLERDRTASPLRWLQLHGLWAQVRGALRNPREGLRLLERVPDHVGAGTAERAVMEGIRGRLHWMAGTPREAARAFETAAEDPRVLSTPERARLDNNAGLAWYSAGDLDRAVSMWERALAGFERVGLTLEVVRAQTNLCQGYRELGRWRRAELVGQAAVKTSLAAGVDELVAVGLGNLGDVAFAQRQLGLAESRWTQAEVAARRANLTGELLELARRRAELAYMRRAPDVSEFVERALALAGGGVSPTEEARCLALRAATAGLRGDRAGVAADAELALVIGRTLDSMADLARIHLWLAEAWAAVGAVAEATADAVAGQRMAEEFGRKPLLAWADHLLGRLRPTSTAGWAQLERLTELAIRVSRHTSQAELLSELATASVELVGADRALVLLTDGPEWKVAARAARPGVDNEAPPSSSVVRRALSTRREVVVTNLDERNDLNAAESVITLELHAVYCLPLLVDEFEAAGVLYLDSRNSQASLPETSSLLRALAAHATVAVRNARLHDEISRHTQSLREIAHDLRSPLTGISLVVSVDEPLEPSDLHLIRESADHALRLVDQTLGAVPEPPRVFDLGRALQDWAVSLAPQAAAAQVTLSLDTAGRRLVRARRPEMRRVFTNVVGNALRYAPPRSVVHISTLFDGERCGFRVRDQGPGFPIHELHRVFEHGFRGHAARIGGAGLGLSIVRAIVLRHQGEVFASNTPEGGAVVTVWLPAHRPREEEGDRSAG